MPDHIVQLDQSSDEVPEAENDPLHYFRFISQDDTQCGCWVPCLLFRQLHNLDRNFSSKQDGRSRLISHADSSLLPTQLKSLGSNCSLIHSKRRPYPMWEMSLGETGALFYNSHHSTWFHSYFLVYEEAPENAAAALFPPEQKENRIEA